MAKEVKNLVDEGFRVSLVETAFFDGKFEIPHIDEPEEIIIPTGMVPFSLRERSKNYEDFVCFYEHDIYFREILTNTEDYVEDLKGKKVKFDVKVNEIKTRVLPELGTEFYLDLGMDDVKTEEDLRKEIEKNIREEKKAHAEDEYIEECLSKASKNMKVDINEEIIDEEVHRMIHQLEDQLKMQGLNMETYQQFTGITHEKMHEQMEPEARKRVEYRYLLDAIADKEKIEFTKEEVEAKAKEMADNYGISVDELIKAYGSMDIVKYDMRMHKAIEIVKGE